MACIRKKKRKSGYVININDKCIGEPDITLQTFQQKKSAGDDVLLAVKVRISKVKTGQIDINHWTRKEKIEWLRSGNQPVRLEEKELTFFTCHDQYIGECEETNAVSTVQGYQMHLKRAKKFFKDVPLSSIKKTRVQHFVNWMTNRTIADGKNRGDKLSIASMKKDIAAVKRMFKWASGAGQNINLSIFDVRYKKSHLTALDHLTKWDNFETRLKDLEKYQIDKSQEGAFREIVYSKNELADNLQYLKKTLWDDGTFASRRLFTAILVCSCNGIRRSELCRVKRRDLDLENKTIRVWMRKGSKTRDLTPHRRELVEDTIPFLKALLHQTPHDRQCVFCPDDNHMLGESWNQKKEKVKWDAMTTSLETSLKGSIYFNVNGFHVYRHTLASRLLVEGYSQSEVKETIGWCTDEMAQRYQHITRERRRATLESIREDVPSITINN